VLVLLVLSAIATSLRQVAATLRLSADPALEELSRHEKRLEPLKQLLPRHGIVGYVTDAAPPSEAERRYHMTRYILAPLVVVLDARRPLVIGDFTDAAAANRSLDPALPRQNLGQGLVLFAQDQ
jgi:hypothetical protein